MKVALVTPNEGDRALAADFLAEHGIESLACGSLREALERIGPEVGCVVLVEEALVQAEVAAFRTVLHDQPAWSDLPLLLIAGHESALGALVEVFPQSGNVTVLQRPLHPVSLVSSVHMALRARLRQMQVRELLEERDRALSQRDEFLAMLAHELRNPLAPIRNAVYLMKAIDVPDPKFARYRDMIDKQTRHITRLVDDLLDVSRLELGKVELRRQSVDLNQCASSAAEACLPMTTAQRHNVTVRLAQEPLPIMADPVRIEQVLANLIVNAAKFTPSGGHITVEAARDGDFAVARVIDDGRGIDPQRLGAVFELFVQEGQSSARTEGGLGIGLTLVKRLVELHGGTVAVHSEGAGTGCRFETRFPIARLEPGAGPDPVRSAAQQRARRVLVVEDATDSRESLGLLLEMWKHEVTYATDGLEAVACAMASHPDVAIIDIGLPGLDGYEVATRIRQGPQPWSRRVLLLALTGYGQAHDRERALRSGFDEHLLKPVDPAVLERLLID